MSKTGCFLFLIVALAGLTSAAASPDTPPQQPGDTPVPSEPAQTSATFGDWVVRCDRPVQPGAKRVCEAAQSIVVKGQQAPIAQIAFGHTPKETGSAAVTTLTVLLPVGVSFTKGPTLGAASGADDPAAATLTYRRCVPAGCLADAKPDAALIKSLRSANKPHLTFVDAAERTLTLPISFRGLAQALDDLAKEDGRG